MPDVWYHADASMGGAARWIHAGTREWEALYAGCGYRLVVCATQSGDGAGCIVPSRRGLRYNGHGLRRMPPYWHLARTSWNAPRHHRNILK